MPSSPTRRPARPPGLDRDGGRRGVDVEVTAHDHDRLGDVLAPLGTALGRPVPGLWAASSRLADDLPLTAPELAHGAVLGLGGPVPGGGGAPRSSALELRVVGGPDAGRAIPLGQGRHVIGRSSDVSVRLDDPDVSRRHVRVDVGGGSISVTDLGSTNGSRLDDVELDGQPRPWPTGAVLRLGASAVTLAGPGGATAALDPGARGADAGPPGPPARRRPLSRPRSPFPAPPAPPPRRRLAWVAVALPGGGRGAHGLVAAHARRSCSSHCSARWWRWARGSPSAGRAGAAGAGTPRRTLPSARGGGTGSPMRWPPTSARPRRPTPTWPPCLAAARRRTAPAVDPVPRGRRCPHASGSAAAPGPRGSPGSRPTAPGVPVGAAPPARHRRPARYRRARGGRPAGTGARCAHRASSRS